MARRTTAGSSRTGTWQKGKGGHWHKQGLLAHLPMFPDGFWLDRARLPAFQPPCLPETQLEQKG